MTGTNHGMTGAAIALFIKDPFIAVPLSFASHFAVDAIPHFGVRDHYGREDDELFGKKFNVILVLDFLLAISLMLLLGHLFPGRKAIIWLCMIAAACPDLFWVYYRLYVERIKRGQPKYDLLARFHIFLQWSQSQRGAYVEVAWFILMGTIVLSKR